MVRTIRLSFSFLARASSFLRSPSSSLQNTTKLPMRQSLCLSVASSIFLTKLVKPSLISRAKIMATGFPPFLQTWQTFWPAALPVTFKGLNGPGTGLPGCGPDLRPSAAAALTTSSAAAREAPKE
jgi:hypothetical protein